MKNILLTGMSWSGKSTIWKRLAQELKMNYIDFDELLEERWKMSVTALLRSKWDEKFLLFERDVALSLNVENTIISLSGSVCLMEEVMTHLKKNGVAIFIDTHLEIIRSRLENMKINRIVWMENKTLDEIYYSRLSRYKTFSDFIFENKTKKDALWVFTDFFKYFKALNIQ